MDTIAVVLPVRFAGGGVSMQTTTSRLGREGAFVRAMLLPKEKAKGTLSLQAQGFPAVDLKVEVDERVQAGTKGKDAGFWVRFEPLGEREQRLVAAMIDRFGPPKEPPPAVRAPPRPAPDRPRASPRVAAQFRVQWSSPVAFLVAYSENISQGGLFIATDRPPALQEVIELSLQLPDGALPVRTQAQVVQVVTAEQAQAQGRTAGAGLQFVGGDDEFRKRLDACIEHLIAVAPK